MEVQTRRFTYKKCVAFTRFFPSDLQRVLSENDRAYVILINKYVQAPRCAEPERGGIVGTHDTFNEHLEGSSVDFLVSGRPFHLFDLCS